MVNFEMQDYWTLVSAHRRGDTDALIGLELMADGGDKAARMAYSYLCAINTGKQMRTP